MAHKKLDEEQLKELETLVLDGVTPADISDYFGIAVSSVHNYKHTLASQGLEIPDVRGKRPSGEFKERPAPIQMLTDAASDLMRNYVHMVVNGVDLHISNLARTIQVDSGRVMIEL